MVSFLLPSIQKRLLRYALSRLELLDTDRLDLENLDVVWGKTSTVELRDVGLRLKKLASLLQLPPNLELIRAKILILRLTVPADIYSSSITIDIDGVDLQIRELPPSGGGQAGSSLGEPQRLASVKTSVPGGSPEQSRTPNTPGGEPRSSGRPRDGLFDEDEDDEVTDDHLLPNTEDLAASFLQHEPQIEKAQLESVILPSPTDLRGSSLEASVSDEELGEGTGTGVTLPAFLANFLKGVGDRLKVNVRALEIRLDVELRTEGLPRGAKEDGVMVLLKAEEIYFGGITSTPLPDDESNEGESAAERKGGASRDQNRSLADLRPEGTKCVRLGRVQALLVSDAALLAGLEVVSGQASLAATRSDLSGGQRSPMSSRTGTDLGSPTHSTRAAASASNTTQHARVPSHLPASVASSMEERTSRPHQSRLLSESLATSDGGRFGDFSDEDPEASIRSAERTQYLSGRLDDSAMHGSISLGDVAASDLTASEIEAVDDAEADADASPPFAVQSTTPSAGSGTFHSGQTSAGTRRYPAQNRGPAPVEDEDSSPEGSEDLSESKIFSHEEAESMYMSAMSHDVDKQEDSSIGQGSEKASTSSPIRVDSNTPIQGSHAASQDKPSSELSSPQSETYSRTTKHIMDLDVMAIWLNDTTASSEAKPSSDQHVRPDPLDSTSLGASMAGRSDRYDVPGAFSTHLPETRHPLPRLRHAHTVPLAAKSSDEISSTEARPPRPLKNAEAEFGTELELGKINVRVDLAVGRLIVKMIQQIAGSAEESSAPPPKKVPEDGTESRLRVHADAISLKLMERLSGILASSEHSASSKSTVTDAFDDDRLYGEVLLQTAITDLGIETTTKPAASTIKFWAGKASLGHAKDEILSFDETLRAHMSSRDISAPLDKDVRGTILQSADTRRFSLKTLPIHISLNLQKLDETFGWFGGFNSFLGMGSSIASNTTVTKPSPTRPKPSGRPRGVHFAAPASSDPDSAPESTSALENKADLRMAGMAIDVIGKDSRVTLRSSALKLVSREEGIGAQVDHIDVSGPHVIGATGDPPIQTDVLNVRLEYLPKPKEVDLARLLGLLTPSHNKYGQDDDILLDTLLRQRRQGPVLRITIAALQSDISKLEEIDHLQTLGEEMARLSTVTKYLPEDDRPGILTLGLIKQLDCQVQVNQRIGKVSLGAQKFEIAHVNLPSLMAFSVETAQMHRNETERLIGKALSTPALGRQEDYPMIMARMIGDEIEPTIKVKLCNLCAEYRVSTLLAVLEAPTTQTSEELLVDMTTSIVALTGRVKAIQPRSAPSPQSPSKGRDTPIRRPLKVDVTLRDCTVGLIPLDMPSKGLVVFTDTRLVGSIPMKNHFEATLEVHKASLLIVDDQANLEKVDDATTANRKPSAGLISDQIAELCSMGYVSVSYISSAKVNMRLVDANLDGEKTLDVEVKDDLLVLESCADSTQTLIGILNGLKPPMPRSVDVKYRTEVIPVQDMLASLSGNAFDGSSDEDEEDEGYPLELDEEGDMVASDVPHSIAYGTSFYSTKGEPVSDEVADSILEDEEDEEGESDRLSGIPGHDERDLAESVVDEPESPGEPLDFVENHFGASSGIEGTAHEWNSRKNTYDTTDKHKVLASPVKVRVRDVHVIWNLYDGYDWQKTRDAIAKTVEAVETKANERRARNDRRTSYDAADEDESVIGDFLFNSIYIGVPANRDPKDLAHQINRNVDDLASETGSYTTTTTVPGSPSGPPGRRPRPSGRRLRLQRSKHHKMCIELKGICMDLVVFPPASGETQSSLDVRVRDFEIFDLVPTSTWKKFATYMHDAGDRESGTNMIHLELLNVRPVPELAASEIVVKATVLPLRLHVDQDALDFITRFFEFKDTTNTALTASKAEAEEPFLQRVEVNSVRVRLDYKPKTVDYAGLRSGHTTEFMNFFILDQADMVLRHVIIYGVSGFDKLSKTLNDIWMPDIKRTQLPGVLAGLAPVRSLVTVGSGVRDLVVIPLREYRKDGRVVRSMQKGALTFAKTTTSELVKLGAKLAIGTQTVLQGAEDFLAPVPASSSGDMSLGEGGNGWEDTNLLILDDDEKEKKQISPYADQPLGVMQGLRGAYASLERDLRVAKDAVIAMPGEVMESGSAGAAARAVLRRAPTVVLRPAIGASKAVGQTLLGATNSLDRTERRRVDDKYKKH